MPSGVRACCLGRPQGDVEQRAVRKYGLPVGPQGLHRRGVAAKGRAGSLGVRQGESPVGRDDVLRPGSSVGHLRSPGSREQARGVGG